MRWAIAAGLRRPPPPRISLSAAFRVRDRMVLIFAIMLGSSRHYFAARRPGLALGCHFARCRYGEKLMIDMPGAINAAYALRRARQLRLPSNSRGEAAHIAYATTLSTPPHLRAARLPLISMSGRGAEMGRASFSSRAAARLSVLASRQCRRLPLSPHDAAARSGLRPPAAKRGLEDSISSACRAEYACHRPPPSFVSFSARREYRRYHFPAASPLAMLPLNERRPRMTPAI